MEDHHSDITDQTIALMDLKPSDRVLDLGCGTAGHRAGWPKSSRAAKSWAWMLPMRCCAVEAHRIPDRSPSPEEYSGNYQILQRAMQPSS